MLEYWLVKYVVDPERDERRTIGVIVCGRGCTEFVGLGDGPGVDIERFRPLTRGLGDELWVYREWIGWFQDLCLDAHKDMTAFRSRLASLEGRGRPFVASYCGEIEPRMGETVKKFTRRLYAELVEEPVPDPMDNFQQRVEEILGAAGMRNWESLKVDVDVRFPAQHGLPAQTAFFDYLIESPPRVVFRCLPVKQEPAAVEQDAREVMAVFRAVVALEFVAPARCVLLTGPFPEESKQVLAELEAVARIVDVTSPLAARKVREILSGH